jgi:hypothetical protein
MTREERGRLKRQLIAQHPDAARALGLVRDDALRNRANRQPTGDAV